VSFAFSMCVFVEFCIHYLAIVCFVCSEWAVNIQRDSYASYIGHYPLLAYFAIAENESIGRERYSFMQVIFLSLQLTFSIRRWCLVRRRLPLPHLPRPRCCSNHSRVFFFIILGWDGNCNLKPNCQFLIN